MQYQCCGIYKLKDYGDAYITVPSSCYDQNDTPYRDGCLAKMETQYEELLKGPKIVGWMLMVIEVGFALSFWFHSLEVLCIL